MIKGSVPQLPCGDNHLWLPEETRQMYKMSSLSCLQGHRDTVPRALSPGNEQHNKRRIHGRCHQEWLCFPASGSASTSRFFALDVVLQLSENLKIQTKSSNFLNIYFFFFSMYFMCIGSLSTYMSVVTESSVLLRIEPGFFVKTTSVLNH